ncbi:putative chromatin regulator PHD family [Arabidopsis thaliana]|nr:Protein kinase C-like phorbol ester/diacylglycerol-binding domain [Arabidopsis thaliana x Arabidopsis arenosa]
MNLTLQGHEHRVSLIYHRDGIECDACDRSYGVGFSCSECKFTIHMKCIFVFNIQEIFDHPSHVGHCLKLLTTGAPDHTDPKCHLCGRNTKRLLYHCSDCKLNLDVDCMANTKTAQAYLNVPWHKHPLLMFDFVDKMPCDVCDMRGKQGYFCPRCRLVIHESCFSVFDSPEITHPSHVRHPLKLLTSGVPDYTKDRSCHTCGDETGSLIYHCDMCKFNLDLRCAIKTLLPIALSNMKVHEHTLTLMPRLISFVCDACGMKGDRAPYVCVQCDFMTFHQECTHLPRVIHVNHHDHRVSFKYPLGPGEWRCGVCWEEIDWSYGAYSCSFCPSYAIHSRCATRKDVWDGKELDGVPEEVEDVEPFKRNADNTIKHFAHQHNLMSFSKDSEESNFCGACVCPIGSCTFYKCSESDCSFILHETCANLRKKKRHFLSPQPLTLDFVTKRKEEKCGACHQICCQGFIYSTYQNENFDLLCSSITVPFIHGGHDHHLLYIKLEYGQVKTCKNCGIDEAEVVLGCIKCNYFLDFRCATLPLTVSLPRYDDHSLTLCYGDEKASGRYWCDICERETNPKSWFYTCKDCGVTLHIFCVVGDIRYAKPRGMIDRHYRLLSNNSSSRPLCNTCNCRCPGPFILHDPYNYHGFISRDDSDVLYFCSYYCFVLLARRRRGNMCPPWALEPNT